MDLLHTREGSWRKSSFSGGNNECIEVAPWGEVRDSKNPMGPTIKVNVHQFIGILKQLSHR